MQLEERRKQGLPFEKYMVSRFKETSTLLHWTSDKIIDDVMAPDITDPDLLFRDKATGQLFAVECKWHYSKIDERSVILASYRKQLDRYRSYQTEKMIPVFIAVGIGESGSDIDKLFVVPLHQIPADSYTMTLKELEPYALDVTKENSLQVETRVNTKSTGI